MNINIISFPCVILFRNGDLNACSNKITLSLFSEQFVDNGNLIFANIIDANGNLFTIDNIIKLKNRNIFPKCLTRYSKRIVEVTFTLNFIEKLDVIQMKEHIIRSLNVNEKLFFQYQELGIIQMIRGAENYIEIIETFGIE